MIAIVTVDDNNGIFFNRRRQSRDSTVIKKVASLANAKNSYLLMNSYSSVLFESDELRNAIVSDKFLEIANDEDYCFVEGMPLTPYISKIQQLIVFRWNRRYPADMYFDINLADGWSLIDTEEFKGTSHDKITMEVYGKCDVRLG